MKKLLMLLMISCVYLFAQTDTVYVNGMYSGGSEGELNAAVEAAINAGTLSSKVFKLNSYDWYVITGTIIVPAGETLTMVAPNPGNDQNSAPPQILWTASSSVTKEFMIQVYGDLTLKNIWIRYADVAGIQTGTPIVFDGDTTSNSETDQEVGIFENCVFEWMPCPAVTASGSICVRSEHFNGDFKNCYFRNCVDGHYMYYGRAVSFPYDVPGYHIDRVNFENCSFANMGYVYMQEGTNYGDNVHFNHCTFYNILQFSLESGWWYNLNVNNCLFVNAWMMGYVPAAGVGGATITIEPADSIDFAVPFTDQDRRILFSNSAYYLEDWLVDWMRGGWEKNYRSTEWRPDPRISDVGCPYSNDLYTQRVFDEIPYPRPMLDSTALVYFDSTDADGNKIYPLINRTQLYDVYEAEDKAALNPGFEVVPLNEGPLKWFLNEKWGTNLDSMWAYDIDAGYNQTWPLPENLAYTNEMYQSAGMSGFPLGDLYHWWNPSVRSGATDYYTAWKAQAEEERATIAAWLEDGVHPDSVVAIDGVDGIAAENFVLCNNYPNPFNPTTNIEYTIPMRTKITLSVFDVLGHEVAKLYDGYRDAGSYTAKFDATNLPSNVYFYQLKSGNAVITKKMILIK